MQQMAKGVIAAQKDDHFVARYLRAIFNNKAWCENRIKLRKWEAHPQAKSTPTTKDAALPALS